MALEHIELSGAFDYGGLAVLRDAWECFAVVVGSRKLSNLYGSNTARVGEGGAGEPMHCRFVRDRDVCWPPNQRWKHNDSERGRALRGRANAAQNRTSQPDALHLAKCNLVLCPIVKLRSARRFVPVTDFETSCCFA